jgi:hypothetical protein
MLRREGLYAVDGKEKLEVQRLLGPERAIIIEGGDSLGDGHEVRRALCGDFRDEIHDGLLCLALVPRWKCIGCVRDGRCKGHRAHESGGQGLVSCFHC